MPSPSSEQTPAQVKVTPELLPCPFCKKSLRVVPSLAKSFSPSRPLVEYIHDDHGCLMGRWGRAFYDDEPEKFERFAAQWNSQREAPERRVLTTLIKLAERGATKSTLVEEMKHLRGDHIQENSNGE